MEDLYSLIEIAESNEDYRTILEILRWYEGFSCPRCSCTEAYRIKTRSLFECKNCRMQVSATSGTFLHGVRNLRVWVKAILSFATSEGQSAVSVARLFNRGYSTAWFMMQKIRMVLENGFEESGEAYFLPCSMLKEALFKASSGDEHFELDEAESCSEPVLSGRAAVLVAFLLGTFRGVSRKYSQLYALEFAYRSLADSAEPIRLLSMFVRGRIARRKTITSYVAPYLIRLPSAL